MRTLGRTDTSLVGRWWWTVDRWTLAALFLIAGLGAVLTLAASPAVAERIGLDTFYFARRQFVFLPLAFALMLSISLLSVRGIRRISIGILGLSVVGLISVLAVGTEIKGASRWIELGGFSFQPSEFVKPSLAVVLAWILSARDTQQRFSAYAIATGLFLCLAALLLFQPDVGMTMVLASVWGAQMFVSGLPLAFVGVIAAAFVGAGIAAYFTFHHVQARVDQFFDPSSGDGYQVMRGLEAFRNGGLFGRGPGEGQVKAVLPDAHTDFVFAVAGEEFGLLACLVIVGLFAFVVLRGLARVLHERDLFIVLSVVGLLTTFALQALINMASAIHLIPPKGMTLPFVSYGGSSVLAVALAMGMVLALTRRRPVPGGPL